MANTLFDFPGEPFPENIVDFELTDIERITLKVLAYTNTYRAITPLKQMVYNIVQSFSGYGNHKKKTTDAAINKLKDRKLLISNYNQFILDPSVVNKLTFLAPSNKHIIKSAYQTIKRFYPYGEEATMARLTILSGDAELAKKEFFSGFHYHYNDPLHRIYKELVNLGSMEFILPVLKSFPDEYKNKFLCNTPFYLHSWQYNSWANILLHPKTKYYPHAILNFLSCAQLVIPLQEVAELTERFDIDSNTLFFLEVLKGYPGKALDMGTEYLMFCQEMEGHKRKELPGVFGLLYAICLLISGDGKNLALAATFARKTASGLPELGGEYNAFKNFSQILTLFIDHKLGKKQVSIYDFHSAWKSRLHSYFLAGVLSWFGKSLEEELPSYLPDKLEMEYRAAGWKGSGESDEAHKKKLEELKEKLATIPLAELITPEQPWEKLLVVLEGTLLKSSAQKGGSVEKSRRLIWLVDPLNSYSLDALEQTMNKSGWTKGKRRSLAGLLNKIPEFATSQDVQIINCFVKDYYYGVQINNWEHVIEVLASHPHVYTTTEPRMPIEIRIQPAQVQIDKSGSGAAIRLIPENPKEVIVKESPTKYIYYKWDSHTKKVYSVLRESDVTELRIPKEGLERAKPVIESITQVMPVTGSFAKASAPSKKSASAPVLLLTPVSEQLHVQLLIELIKGQEPRLVPGVGSTELLVQITNGKKVNVKRDKGKEKGLILELANKVSWLQEMKSNSAQMFIENDHDILDFLSELKEKAPDVSVIWPKGERFRIAQVVSYADIRMNIKKAKNWFEIDGEVDIDNKVKLSIQQLLEKSEGGTLNYIQLDDKTFLAIQKDLKKRLTALDAVAHSKGTKLQVHALGASAVEGAIEDMKHVSTDKVWKSHIAQFHKMKSYSPSIPQNLEATLRPYQEEGILWLDRMYNWGVGCCLADDMGLGKTIQALGIMLKYASQGPSLVVAPSSVCHNWKKEIVRFAPTLVPCSLKTQNREADIKELDNRDVLVVSYGIIQSNPELLAIRKWNTVVLDEAHAIKNPKSIRAQSVMKLESDFKILTTGTPIQNHLGDIWSLFQFMNPGMLGTFDQFSKKYGQNGNDNKTRHSRSALNRYISPFILRRNKNDVLDDLPDKTEINLNVALSKEERAMYEVLREKAIAKIEGVDNEGGARHIQILAEITRLRQMSCNPLLVEPSCNITSSKLDALENLVNDLLAAKHKALVFSQFTSHLAIIRQMLDRKEITYQYLDGSTPAKKRELAIQAFQNGESELFLISLKAGGVGLNLTAADYVIHMDPWWNPAVEDQASDRAHRIGQTRPVTIYRLIAENTIEEKIVKLHHEKRDLADKLLAGTDQSAKISSDELFNLITEKQ